MAARRKEPSPIRTLVVAAFVIILLLAIWLVIANPRASDEAAPLPPITNLTQTASPRLLATDEAPAVVAPKLAKEAPLLPKVEINPTASNTGLNTTGPADVAAPTALTPAQAAKAAQVEDYAAQVGDTRAAAPPPAPKPSNTLPPTI
jgi:hypothetical protein